MLNDVAVSCSRDLEWVVQFFLAQNNIYRADGSKFLQHSDAIEKTINTSKTALINVTGMILLVFVLWAFLLIVAVIFIFVAVVVCRIFRLKQWPSQSLNNIVLHEIQETGFNNIKKSIIKNKIEKRDKLKIH